MFSVLRRFRPDFLTRISNIIIIQVIFVFAAVGMIFFYPQQGHQRGIDYDVLRSELDQLSADLTSAHTPDVLPDSNQAIVDVMDRAFASDNKLSHLEWYVADNNGRLTNLINFDRQTKKERSVGRTAILSHPSVQSEIAQLIHSGPLRTNHEKGNDILIPFITPNGSTACYYQDRQAPGTITSLVAVYDDDLFVASRSTLEYGLVLVFLTSTLISLLIAYVLIKRYRNPLRRLIRGFEQTARGELYQMVEPDGDSQLKRLSETFNTMSETLWANRQQMKDINRQLQQTNKTLEDSRRFLRTMIDSSPVSVLAVSEDGRVTLCNKKATEDTGYESECILSQSVNALFARPISERFEKAREHGTHGFEAICVRRDGSQFPAYLIATPIETDTGANHGYLLMMKDISESQSFQEMMIRIDRFCTRGEMAGDIAHEINNYLTILSGNIELMPLLLKKNNMERLEMKLTLMRETIDKIARFCDGLMDANQGEAHFEPADLNQLIQNVVAFLKPQNKFDEVEVSLNLAKDLPAVEFDIGQIQQVLVNTIYNAAEALAGEDGEKAIVITTGWRTSAGGTLARVSVHDTGPGVAENKLPLLFEKRFTTKPRGHGIGLITCKRILDTHNGVISYSYENGACFEFRMPLTQPKNTDVAGQAETAPSDSVTTEV